MNWESTDPLSYLHAMRTDVPIELEALSYHSCPRVRTRVASRTNRAHVLERLGRDQDPLVVLAVIDNKHASVELIELIGHWMIHSDKYFHMVWYFLEQHEHTLPWMKIYYREKELQRRANIRKELGLPPVPKNSAKRADVAKRGLSLLTEKRLILEVLRAHYQNRWKMKKRRIPWGVTPPGWLAYSTHWSKEVRDATHAHPYYRMRLLKIKIISFLRAAFV